MVWEAGQQIEGKPESQLIRKRLIVGIPHSYFVLRICILKKFQFYEFETHFSPWSMLCSRDVSAQYQGLARKMTEGMCRETSGKI